MEVRDGDEKPVFEHGILMSTTGLNKKFQRKIVNIFLLINFNICFGCSKEPSH